jgi:hypothetical protein
VSRDAVTNAEGQVTGVEIPPHEMHSGYWFTYPELIHVEFGRRFEDMPGFLSDEDDSASGDESDLGVLHEKLDDLRREVDKQRTYAEVYKSEYEKCKELNAVLNARLLGAYKAGQLRMIKLSLGEENDEESPPDTAVDPPPPPPTTLVAQEDDEESPPHTEVKYVAFYLMKNVK